MEIYEGLAQIIMKAKKSHDLLSASKRLRKVRGLVLVHLQRLGNQNCGWWKSWSKGKRRPMSRSSREEWISIPLAFVLFKPSTDWMIPPSPHWGVQSTLLIMCIQMLVLPRTSLIDTPRNNVLSEHAMVLLS